ncbi:MAG: response regulator transcription factor [Chitinophagaceae bacterium]|nr:response regulator transcription factor [Chitinophagaceae bacterium]
MPDILIAEDHSIVRIGTAMLLRDSVPNAVITDVETFDEVIQEVDRNHFDLLLLDIHIPGGDNFQMIEAVHLRRPGLRILVFSSYEEQLYAIRSLKSGAMGYIHKRSSPEEVVKAVKQVLKGEKYISEDVKSQLIGQLLSTGPSQKDSLSSLSNRELEVMRLMLRGASTMEIKNTLNIRDSTISTYKTKIFSKLQVSNLIELSEKLRLMEGYG